MNFQNAFVRTAAGSMMAGVVAGYLSHIPHNVSTLKLLQVHSETVAFFSSGGFLLHAY